MFLDYARSRALVPRLLEHVSKRCENPLLADDEIHVLRTKMAEFLIGLQGGPVHCKSVDISHSCWIYGER